jgi:hypothetical protein
VGPSGREVAFAAVRDIVNQADPESLQEVGAPLNEYEPEKQQGRGRA